MARRDEKAITPRNQDYNRWYQDIVLKAELADYSPVKGCMVIRPNGYSLWENMQKTLDSMFKATGHVNAYFPIFIPESFLKREAEHVEGFAPELAVVTHAGGKKLDEAMVIRPTSETIMYTMYSKWIKSYRDLPLLINQWANVVRWEMHTRLFLRTTEFLWQEGHTAHTTHEEAWNEVLRILDIYAKFAEEWMALPVIKGFKTDAEKFAGAVKTTCIEALMQDGKALQSGTSHDLGQNFSKVFDVRYQDEEGSWQYCWQTSWGVSTRLIGALVMAHSDDQGLVLPPRLAPIQVVIVPIFRDEASKEKVLAAARKLKEQATSAAISVVVDERDTVSTGFKFNYWELRGVPIRVEIGPRDVEDKSCLLVPRIPTRVLGEGERRQKEKVSLESAPAAIKTFLGELQAALYRRALDFRESRSRPVDDYGEFKTAIREGGFFWGHWCERAECEAAVKEETGATIRCLPIDREKEPGKCMVCGADSPQRVLWARGY